MLDAAEKADREAEKEAEKESDINGGNSIDNSNGEGEDGVGEA